MRMFDWMRHVRNVAYPFNPSAMQPTVMTNKGVAAAEYLRRMQPTFARKLDPTLAMDTIGT